MLLPQATKEHETAEGRRVGPVLGDPEEEYELLASEIRPAKSAAERSFGLCPLSSAKTVLAAVRCVLLLLARLLSGVTPFGWSRALGLLLAHPGLGEMSLGEM